MLRHRRLLAVFLLLATLCPTRSAAETLAGALVRQESLPATNLRGYGVTSGVVWTGPEGGSVLELRLAAPSGLSGTAVIDLGLVEH